VAALVDRVDCEPVGPAADKGRAFREACAAEGVDPRECAVVGDRPDAEIAAGRSLGMFTVRVRRGEHERFEPRSPAEAADATVADFPAAAAILLRR
jgi:FMN phosphatase YigB (HAD superfamily)